VLLLARDGIITSLPENAALHTKKTRAEGKRGKGWYAAVGRSLKTKAPLGFRGQARAEVVLVGLHLVAVGGVVGVSISRALTSNVRRKIQSSSEASHASSARTERAAHTVSSRRELRMLLVYF